MDKAREFVQRMGANVPAGGGGGGMRALGLGAVGLSGLAYGSTSCLFNVEGGHRAVMYHRFGGVQERVRTEGTHIVVPWFQRPILYDVRAKPRMIQSLTGSKGARYTQLHALLPCSAFCCAGPRYSERACGARRWCLVHRYALSRRGRAAHPPPGRLTVRRSPDGEHLSARALTPRLAVPADHLPGARH